MPTKKGHANANNLQSSRAGQQTYAQKKQAEKKRKRLLAIIASILIVLLIAAASVFIWNYEGTEGDETGEQDSTGQQNQDNGDNGNRLSDGGGSGHSGGLTYESPIDIDPDDEVYLREDSDHIAPGLEEYEEEHSSEADNWEAPDGSVSDYQEGGSDEADTGNTYTPGEQINRNDVNNADSSVRYYIEQRGAEVDGVGSSTSGNSGGVASMFPSRDAGYTNNYDLYQIDGQYNPMYSYVLAEDVQFFYGHHLQRLLNPVYGNWWEAQMGNEYPYRHVGSIGGLQDMFHPDWWEENVVNGGYENVPVLADWNGDNFGNDELTDGPRWFGEIRSHNVSLGSNDRITSTFQVRWTAYTSDDSGADRERVTKDSTLRLVLEPNPNPYAVNNRLVIVDAELTVNN
ncbi:hypothetical protein [Nesterenkonia alba]|uniref:hypothetical protein n=1 Tax=Nesterenkonia alba TaxID=515814 RepID=UPI0003B5A4C1|nr:hypothetical protein [Nesterenkonia alba]